MTRKYRFGNFSWLELPPSGEQTAAAPTAPALGRTRFYERREATVLPKLMGKRLVVRCRRVKHPYQSSAQQKRPAKEKPVEQQAPANFVARPAISSVRAELRCALYLCRD